MTIDVTLIKTAYRADDAGFEQPYEMCRTLVTETDSIARAEFFAAGREGYRPEISVKIFAEDYDGEQIAVIGGKRYTVYRTYTDWDSEETELYLQREEAAENVDDQAGCFCEGNAEDSAGLRDGI